MFKSKNAGVQEKYLEMLMEGVSPKDIEKYTKDVQTNPGIPAPKPQPGAKPLSTTPMKGIGADKVDSPKPESSGISMSDSIGFLAGEVELASDADNFKGKNAALFNPRKYKVSLYVSPSQKAEKVIIATTPHGAAKKFVQEVLGEEPFSGGLRQEQTVSQGDNIHRVWSIQLPGYGQKLWVKEYDPMPVGGSLRKGKKEEESLDKRGFPVEEKKKKKGSLSAALSYLASE